MVSATIISPCMSMKLQLMYLKKKKLVNVLSGTQILKTIKRWMAVFLKHITAPSNAPCHKRFTLPIWNKHNFNAVFHHSTMSGCIKAYYLCHLFTACIYTERESGNKQPSEEMCFIRHMYNCHFQPEHEYTSVWYKRLRSLSWSDLVWGGGKEWVWGGRGNVETFSANQCCCLSPISCRHPSPDSQTRAIRHLQPTNWAIWGTAGASSRLCETEDGWEGRRISPYVCGK